jgi:hypothetical protein
MSRFHRNSMNVNGIPMSYELIDFFRDAGAVNFDRDVVDQVQFDECYRRHVLPEGNYDYLVEQIEEWISIYRTMLKFYLNRDSLPVYRNLIRKLGQFDPGDRVNVYLLYFNELALSYPCKTRGTTLRNLLAGDLARFELFFPNVSPQDLVHMMREVEFQFS